jgi:Mrp family chromosome partitioning ATPase
VLHYSEASILADIADMAVLVVPSKETTPNQINESIELLGQNKVAGVVFTETDSTQTRAGQDGRGGCHSSSMQTRASHP